MTVTLLMKSVGSFVKTAAGESIGVHQFFLPTKTEAAVRNKESEFPYIIIRPIEGNDRDEESVIQLKLMFGIRSEDDDGAIDLFNLMEKVRQAFLKQPLIDKSYLLERPYKWRFFDEQPYPEWIGEAVLTFVLPTTNREDLNL